MNYAQILTVYLSLPGFRLQMRSIYNIMLFHSLFTDVLRLLLLSPQSIPRFKKRQRCETHDTF